MFYINLEKKTKKISDTMYYVLYGDKVAYHKSERYNIMQNSRNNKNKLYDSTPI